MYSRPAHDTLSITTPPLPLHFFTKLFLTVECEQQNTMKMSMRFHQTQQLVSNTYSQNQLPKNVIQFRHYQPSTGCHGE